MTHTISTTGHHRVGEPFRIGGCAVDSGPHCRGRGVAAVYPARTYERLAVIKRKYDPSNLFARNHNVPPAAE